MSRLQSNQNGVIASGKALRLLRDRHRISQRELAARSGVDRGHISRYETGLMAPSLFTAVRLARALGYALESFWGELPRMAARQAFPREIKPKKLKPNERGLCSWIAVRVEGFWRGASWRWNELLEDVRGRTPWKTRDRAKQRLRNMEAKGIVVYLGDGRYRLSRLFHRYI